MKRLAPERDLPNVVSTEEQIRRLDLALAELESCPKTEACNLAHEHIYGAKVYLLGAMPNEYATNLQLAREALARLDDKQTKQSVEALLNPVKDGV